jgi:hypothetical protein
MLTSYERIRPRVFVTSAEPVAGAGFISDPQCMPTTRQKKVQLFALLRVYIVAHRHGICIIRAITTENDDDSKNLPVSPHARRH